MTRQPSNEESHRMTETASLPALLWRARIAALAAGGPAADEVAPGVLRAEADIAAWHAIAVQGGFSDPEREAERLSKDRKGVAPTEPEGPLTEPLYEPPPTSPAFQQWDAENTAALNAVEVLPVEPPTPVVNYEPGSRLEQLHAEYHAAKAEAASATERAKAATDALKVELTTAAPGAPRIDLAGPAGAPLHLSYSETWRFDSKKFKADDPETYVRYAKQSGSWTLRAGTAAAE